MQESVCVIGYSGSKRKGRVEASMTKWHGLQKTGGFQKGGQCPWALMTMSLCLHAEMWENRLQQKWANEYKEVEGIFSEEDDGKRGLLTSWSNGVGLARGEGVFYMAQRKELGSRQAIGSWVKIEEQRMEIVKKDTSLLFQQWGKWPTIPFALNSTALVQVTTFSFLNDLVNSKLTPLL